MFGVADVFFADLEDRDRKNRHLLDELDALKSRVADVECLRQENESLQAEIGRFRNKQGVQSSSSEKRIALGDISPNKLTAQQRVGKNTRTPSRSRDPDISVVATRFKETAAKYKDAQSKVQELRTKLRERNAQCDEWANLLAVQEAKIQKQQDTIQKLRAKLRAHSSSTLRTSSVGATSVDEDTVEVAYPKRPSPLSSIEQEPTSSPPVGATLHIDPTYLFPTRHVSEPPPHLSTDDLFGVTGNEAMQKTEEAPEELDLPSLPDQPVGEADVIIKTELSSDELILWEEPARKRKHIHGESGSKRVRGIKSEHSSSSAPEIIHESLAYSPAESIDYDQEVHVPTPRKRRAMPAGVRVGPDTISEETPRPRLLMPEQLTQEISDATVSAGLDKSRVPLQGPMVSKSHEHSAYLDVLLDPSHVPPTAKVDISVKPKSDINANPLTIEGSSGAGDGDSDVGRQLAAIKGHLETLLRTSPTKVSALTVTDESGVLAAQTPGPRYNGIDESRFSAPPKFSLGSKKANQDSATPTLKRSIGATLPSNSSVSRERAPKKPSILRDDMPRGRSETRKETPLREKPVGELRPEDFKVNPKYNDNIPYAYDEVVRGRDARAAIAGCIDPKCCGKTFRHFADTELQRIGHSLTTRREEVILMERYLDNDAFKLSMMEPEERQETWLKAKTWDLANKFGKHRQRYSRMPTPPGFWNVDFPNTQERAEERRQAEEIRKALVAERYREAMRCDGSWLFRDEEPR